MSAEIQITLPDGSVRSYPAGTTGAEVAESIGKGLLKAALAVRMNGELWDLKRPLPGSCQLAALTSKDRDGLEIMRHDGAHIMAQAVKALFPKTQVTIGPVIEDGFFYDFLPETPFTPEDLVKIEEKMHEIVNADFEITREEWNRDQAIEFFKGMGEDFKAEIIGDIPKGETITLYRQGDFIDLCRGPHLPSTGKLGHGFKVMKLAGAYWRGDSNNPMLQRIYGTAWANEKDLKAYLVRLEEAAKRDHRKLGKEMDLFHFQEESPGSVFWHPKGWDLFQNLIAYMRRIQNRAGFQEVNAPDMMDRSLWEASGHWEKFGENMFSLESPDEKRTYALKPMNCPGHVQIFKQGITSYRDLPIRLAEFGKVHRYEPSGALHGLMRVRSFTQDDAHIFCREDQITEESKKVCELILSLYKDFGFDDIDIKFADRPEKRVGSDEVWDHAEKALKDACSAMGLEYTLNPGEGAFYGPKLEFVLKDAIGRHWQVGTLQVDLNLPARLGATYIDEKSDKVHPVMLHRAMFGSIERFTGILIEHYAGKLPLWLSPTQVVVNTIISDVDSYALEIQEKLRNLGIKAETDLRNEKISYKVREHFHAKVPALFILGKREADERKVAIRRLGTTDNIVLPLEEAIEALVQEAKPPR